MRKTKIIATMGPSSSDYKTFKSLVQAGLNVARINLSHGETSKHQKVVDTIKQVRSELKMPVSIMVDTRGPEVRVKNFDGGQTLLKKGSYFILYNYDKLGNNEGVSVTEPDCLKDIPLNTTILANDGLITFKVVEQLQDGVKLKVLSGGVLKDSKGLTFKGYTPNLPYISTRDRNDLIWAFKNKCEYVALSFVTKKEDVLEIKELMKECNYQCKIISKIESLEGVKNLNEILKVSDGIMVARGDLGVEVPFYKVPFIQTELINKSRLHGKITIVATEMLESMINNPRPTRAEASDVATAVKEGASAVMLSAETAVGKYPVATVKAMSEICVQAEHDIDYTKKFKTLNFNSNDITDVLTYSTVNASFNLKSKAIMVFTTKGKMANFVSRFLPICPIVAITDNENTYHALSLVWGVSPILTTNFDENKIFDISVEIAKSHNIAKTNDNVLVVTGTTDLHSNIIKITKI